MSNPPRKINFMVLFTSLFIPILGLVGKGSRETALSHPGFKNVCFFKNTLRSYILTFKNYSSLFSNCTLNLPE